MSSRFKLFVVLVLVLVSMFFTGCDFFAGLFGMNQNISIDSHDDGDIVANFVHLEGSYEGQMDSISVHIGANIYNADLSSADGIWFVDFDSRDYANGAVDVWAYGEADGEDAGQDSVSLDMENYLFVADGNIGIVDDFVAGAAPSGLIKAIVNFNNLPPELNGRYATLTGERLFTSDGIKHSWDNSLVNFSAFVSSGQVSFTVYFDPTFDHAGYPAGSYTADDDITLVLLFNGTWIRMVNSLDNAQDTGQGEETVFILDADLMGVVVDTGEVTITVDYSTAVPWP